MAKIFCVANQKGGVGKSTVSANLAAYLRRQGQTVTMIDFDTHGSSSTWLTRAPNIGVVVQHHILPLDQGGNRPILDARLHLRRAASSTEVVICDLTWTDSIAGELMFEFDLVIVPTSVSEIELAATAGFLSRHRWVFDSAIHTPPPCWCALPVCNQISSKAMCSRNSAFLSASCLRPQFWKRRQRAKCLSVAT